MALIDLRSDTVTLPTPGMKEAMFAAELGDDVFGEDPTVNALQSRVAAMFGKEAGLFCPSGTMANQVALSVHCRPGDEVICSNFSHIFLYESGGIARNAGASAKMVTGDQGRLSAEDVKSCINPDAPYFAVTRLVSLEDTVNQGGGCTYDLKDIKAIREVCDEHGIKLHLDGARVMNSLAATGYDRLEYASNFDSMSICFSKGLGCPVGSMLLGTEEFIKNALRVRKSFGGGMRQAGYLAAAVNYALDHHVDRLVDDHNRAKKIEEALKNSNLAKSVLPVTTNIVVFSTNGDPAVELEKLKDKGILAVPFGGDQLRMVTHLDFDDNQLEVVEKVIGDWELRWTSLRC
jgi:threonine aldolase